jgi:hypothetical protein
MSVENHRLAQSAASILPAEALVMALLMLGYGDQDKLKAAYPDIAAEWHYRHWSGGALLPGEPGYNPAYDDNLLVEGK